MRLTSVIAAKISEKCSTKIKNRKSLIIVDIIVDGM
jgi:hypothetical protein